MKLNFTVEGNDDPEFEYGYGLGVANSAIVGGVSSMSPGPLVLDDTGGLLDVPVTVNVTTAVVDAINNGDSYYRVALTADPSAGTDGQAFVSASFFGPELNVEVVPEPSTFALFGLGFFLYGVRRYRRRKQTCLTADGSTRRIQPRVKTTRGFFVEAEMRYRSVISGDSVVKN